MPRGKGRAGGHYDYDDYDDGADDYDDGYDYDDQYEEYGDDGRLAASGGGEGQWVGGGSASGGKSKQSVPQQTAAAAAATNQSTAAAVWRCHVCTFDNPPTFLACDMCGSARQPQAGSAEEPPLSDSFQFDTPSPDDAVLHAQRSGISSKPSGSANRGVPAPAATKGKGKGKDAGLTEKGKKSVEEGLARLRVSGEEAQPSGESSSGGSSSSRSANAAAAAVEPSAAATTTTAAVGDARRRSIGVLEEGKGKGTRRLSEAAGSDRGGGGGSGPSTTSALPLSSYKQEEWMKEAMKSEEERGKDPINLVVLGHVDAGKSTLTGHLLHRLGCVSQRDMHRNRREAEDKGKGSFAYAWVLDEGRDERERGVTMSLTMAHVQTPSTHRPVVLLDAPGHRDFVPSAIAGAAQADAALLVVDATPGAFEAGMTGVGAGASVGVGGGGGAVVGGWPQGAVAGGQTREHAQLAKSLGVERMIVAVNKMDVVDFSREVFNGIRQVLGAFLKQCGFREGNVQWVPMSGLEGENLDKPAEGERLKRWYSGPCLLQAIESLPSPSRALHLPLRLPIAEIVAGGQQGSQQGRGSSGGGGGGGGGASRALGSCAVSGKVESGGMRSGMKVLVMPGAHAATVKAVEAGGRPFPVALAGQTVDVGLAGVDANVLVTGGVVCHPDYPVPQATCIEARVLTLDLRVPLLKGAQVVVHAHCAKEAAVVSSLVSLLDSKSGEVKRQRPRAIASNSAAVIELTLEHAMCVELYSDLRALGRLALRDAGNTVAVGIVTRIVS